MKHHRYAAFGGFATILLASAPALAQDATATGVGIAKSQSNSAAGALAVNRGNGNSSSSLTVNTPANTTQTINSTSTSTSTQTLAGGTNNRTEVTGTSTVKNVPTALAPSLAAAGIETCLGSVSGGGSIVGFGGSFGTTVPDPGCQARLDARTLWSMGLRSAAVARLCIMGDIYNSMPDICEQYRPRVAATAATATYMSAAGPRAGGIELIEGKTGLPRSCDDYNAVRRKCLKWTGEAPRQRRGHVIVAASP